MKVNIVWPEMQGKTTQKHGSTVHRHGLEGNLWLIPEVSDRRVKHLDNPELIWKKRCTDESKISHKSEKTVVRSWSKDGVCAQIYKKTGQLSKVHKSTLALISLQNTPKTYYFFVMEYCV